VNSAAAKWSWRNVLDPYFGYLGTNNNYKDCKETRTLYDEQITMFL